MRSFFANHLGYDPDSFEQHFLLILSNSIVVLLALTLMFGLLAVLLRLRNTRHDRMWAGLHRLWDREILDVLSGDLAPNEFRKHIHPGQELNFVRFLAPYAWRLRGSDLGILAELARYYLPHVLRQLRHSDPAVRVWAVNLLSLFGMPEYEHEIFEALEDDSPIVSMFAANALLGQKKVHYIKPVMNQFHRYDKWNHNSLASLLEGIGSEAVPVLSQIYLDPARDVHSRLVAAEALRRFTPYALADAAAGMLAQAGNTDLQVASLRLLSQIGQAQHRNAVRALCHATGEVLRINAMRTLRHLSVPADRDLFRAALDDPSPWVARQAAWALKELGESAMLEALVRQDHPRAVLARQVLAETH